MDNLKILLVDDEPEALDLLEYMLDRYDGVSIEGRARTIDQAVSLFRKTIPDLVLLDINLPDKDGFRFVEEIREMGHNPGIIFVTAYENYAIKALKSDAFDYILKPINFDELDHALKRYMENREKNSAGRLDDLIDAMSGYNSGKIKLNTRSGYLLLNPSEIVYCRAEGNYTLINLVTGKQEVVAQNLGSIEKILRNNSFFRMNRSNLVNLNFLSSVNRKDGVCLIRYNDCEEQVKIPAMKIRQLEKIFDNG